MEHTSALSMNKSYITELGRPENTFIVTKKRKKRLTSHMIPTD